MTIFKTDRLIVRNIEKKDIELFFDMQGNPNVMNPIPLEAMSKVESDKLFEELTKLDKTTSKKKVWAIDTLSGEQFIGLCAFLKNDENEDEIAYRLREQFWGKGYGTEIAKALIDFSFNEWNLDLITADVNIENQKSVKILEKFLIPIREFYNKKDRSTDRRYKLSKDKWLQRNC